MVLGWSKRGEHWFAQVAYVIEDDGALVQQWLFADLLTPARSEVPEAPPGT